MTPAIHAKRAGSGAPVLLLHGLFGSGANLGALARALSDDYRLLSPDLPGHGRSGWCEAYDLPGMAQALADWLLDEEVAPAHVVGHSLGGKVAMQFALSRPAQVRSLVVADIAPVAYPASHDAVFAALEAVADAGCESRAEAADLMAAHLHEEDVAQFLLASLRRADDGIYRWLFDVAGLRRDYDRLLAAPVDAEPWRGPVLFVKGGASDYLREAHTPAIERLFPDAQLKVMPGCGHWLHAEKPRQFNGIVAGFIAEVDRGERGETNGGAGA